MMFATRRGLADACNSIAKQLETLYSSISVSFVLLILLYVFNQHCECERITKLYYPSMVKIHKFFLFLLSTAFVNIILSKQKLLFIRS